MSDCLDWREEQGDGHCRCYSNGGECCHCGAKRDHDQDPVTDPSRGGQSTAAPSASEPGTYELTVVDVGIRVSVGCKDTPRSVTHQVILEGSPDAVAVMARYLYRKVRLALPPEGQG